MHRYNLDEFSARYGLQDHSLHKIIDHFGGSGGNKWIAGGAVRAFCQGKSISTDIDFFFADADSFHEFVSEYGTDDGRFETKHQTTFHREIDGTRYKIQTIRISYYKSLQECLDTFDFTICQLGIDGDDLVVGPYTMWDLGRNRLVLHKLTYGVATVRRLLKYGAQGFTVCSGCINSILAEVAARPDLVRSDIAYVD